MMKQLLSILLLPFFLLGNSFIHGSSKQSSLDPSLPHFHLTSWHHEHHCHDARSHFHHGRKHAHRAEEKGQTSSTPERPADHDSDAIYLIVLEDALSSLESRLLDAPDLAIDTAQVGGFNETCARVHLITYRSVACLGPPIYLLLAVLRL